MASEKLPIPKHQQIFHLFQKENQSIHFYSLFTAPIIHQYVPYVVTTIPLPFHECDLSNKTVYRVYNNSTSNTTSATCVAGSATLPEHLISSQFL